MKLSRSKDSRQLLANPAIPSGERGPFQHGGPLTPTLTLTVRIAAGDTFVIIGRTAWALLELLAAGDIGCTYVDNPAPRWSGYIHQLRKVGVVIDTVREAHSGQFSGHHARYVLRSTVAIVDVTGGG